MSAAKFSYGQTHYIRGTITRIPEHFYYTGEVEIDGEKFNLADVWTMFDVNCGSYDNTDRPLRRAVAQLVPRGTKVVGVVADEDFLFLQAAPGDGPTVNEQVLRAGLAKINQSAAEDIIRNGNADARAYHRAAVAAYKAAKRSKTGTWGRCAQEQSEWNAWLRREQEKIRESVADARAGSAGGDVDVDVDWGDGYCDTCRIGRRAFGWLF